MAQLNRITVTGAGVLGGQIAWHSAFKGKTVVVHDISANSLDNCRAAHTTMRGSTSPTWAPVRATSRRPERG